MGHSGLARTVLVVVGHESFPCKNKPACHIVRLLDTESRLRLATVFSVGIVPVRDTGGGFMDEGILGISIWDRWPSSRLPCYHTSPSFSVLLV